MGSPPEWYEIIRSARYLGVPPWDLLKMPVYWHNWARMAEDAEHEAEKQIRKAQDRKSKLAKR